MGSNPDAKRPLVIAVDGPAASGKGTIARALAKRFRLPHLDTGLLYRAVALNLLQTGSDPESEFAARRACDIAQIDFADPELRSEAVGGVASRISAYPSVRAALLERQQEFARRATGGVLDGRDIGTVVAPDATVKLFVTASPEARAERRLKELQGRGMHAHLPDVLADIRARDARDAGRAVSPLKPAEDAVTLDTTNLEVEAAIEEAVRIVREKANA
jgi:cytidylate kinase